MTNSEFWKRAAAISALYAIVLAGSIAWGSYKTVTNLRLPELHPDVYGPIPTFWQVFWGQPPSIALGYPWFLAVGILIAAMPGAIIYLAGRSLGVQASDQSKVRYLWAYIVLLALPLSAMITYQVLAVIPA